MSPKHLRTLCLPCLAAFLLQQPQAATGADDPPTTGEPVEFELNPDLGLDGESLERDLIDDGIQIKELDLLRLVVATTAGSESSADRLTDYLSDKRFRIFPMAQKLVTTAADLTDPEELRKISKLRKADLILFIDTKATEIDRFGRFVIFEAESLVRAYNANSGELLASSFSRKRGPRHIREDEAKRGAVDKAAGEATREVVKKMISNRERSMVHEAQFMGVKSNAKLREILDHIETLAGVYSTRQISYDQQKMHAVIEIVALPRTENFWRAHLEGIRKDILGEDEAKDIKLVPSKKMREMFPDWFVVAKEKKPKQDKTPPPFILQELLFKFDSTDFADSAAEFAVQRLADELQKNPHLKIRIVGHTCDIADDKYNLKLSKDRAKKVLDRLVELGIDAARLESDGEGESRPLVTLNGKENPADAEFKRRQNRRVEVWHQL